MRILALFFTICAVKGVFSLSAITTSSNRKTTWFPTKIQETLNYDDMVNRLYVRHIVTETKDMAESIVQLYTSSDCDDMQDDPFGYLAKSMSACSYTKDEGGKIGWIERHEAYQEILPNDVIQQLYAQTPKAGDVLVVPSTTTGQFHVIQVMELWVQMMKQAEYNENRVGAFQGKNAVLTRSKLKGSGVLPGLPANMSTYHVQTAGCQMNVADSERLMGVLQYELGMTPAARPEEADLVLFNTCSIRDHAEQKLYDALGPYAAKKRQGKELALIVTGCVAQQEGEALLRRVPEIDVVLGPQYVPFLKNVLDSIGRGEQMVATAPMLLTDDFLAPPVRGHDVRAWVNIIHGCNEHCTYCVVPATRGMEQSRSMEAILQECQQLADAGYKEITLLGQNIDAYGRDMVPKRTFADLLEYLDSQISPKMRIRYVTSHPRYFSDRVIDAVANLESVCECFHVPFQAGDDQVLKRMRRGYTFDSYMRIIHKIREKAPDASICGDVIVGFPGETDEAFERTLDLMSEVKFDNLNTFAYSPRPNTEAALWDDQVPEDVKAERLQRVQKLAAEHGLERSQRYVGRVEEVLVEDGNPRNPAQVMGRTRQGRQVYFDGDLEKLRGSLVPVRITEARTWSLMGEQHSA